jgi:hydrogenase expression/formation protein HypE
MKKISLELGSGGKMMRDFIAEYVQKTFDNPYLNELSDSSHLPGGIAFTTDSYVVDPIFFPGGDIGTLAVNGTSISISFSDHRRRNGHDRHGEDIPLPQRSLSDGKC